MSRQFAGMVAAVLGASVALYCLIVWVLSWDVQGGRMGLDYAVYDVFHPYVASFIAAIALLLFGISAAGRD